ncbi:MAG: hypothetical protein IJ877_07055 [Candidatus Gastranaerophilales bacterium]|nr:hypothetical protein [Candidatus Gastranaerophilales bacterium]
MKKIILISLCIIVSCLFVGCQNDAIKVYRESSVSKMMKDLKFAQEDHSTVKKSSGVVIYKDETSENRKKNSQSMNFGPRDVDFDMPIKLK